MFAPVRPLVVEALRAGRLPLWNPHEALGVPLLAQIQHGVLHPVSIVAALLAPGASMDALAAAHAVLAALGAALLARELGASRAGAAAAGLGYGLSGYVLGLVGALSYLAGAGAGPWLVLALRRAGRGARYGVVAAGAAFAACAFAGDPQWVMVASGLGLLLAAEAGGPRGAGRAAAGLAVGAGLAAIQLLPSWRFLSETERATPLASGAPDWTRTAWRLTGWRVLEAIAPGLFDPEGRTASELYRAIGRTDPVSDLPFLPSTFVGAALLALAAAGARASRATRLLLAAAAVLAWMAFGPLLGAEQAMRLVPVWGRLRYWEKLAGPITLCLALVAALGVDRLRAPGERAVRALAAAAAALGVAALVLALVPGLPVDASPDLRREAARRLAAGLVHGAAGLGALAAVLAAARRWPAARGRAGALAAATVALSSLAAAPHALHLGDPAARDPAPLRALARADLGPGEIARVATPLLADDVRDFPERFGPPSLDPLDRTLAVDARMGVTPFSTASGVDNVEPYLPMLPRRLALLFDAAPRAPGGGTRALRRFGTTHVVLRAPLDAGELELARAAVAGGALVASEPAWGIAIWTVPHRPWAFFASAAAAAPSEAEAIETLIGRTDAGAPVLLDGPAVAPLAPGRVLRVARSAERVEVEAEADGPALLVLNDAWWPGWEAALDGDPAPVLRADLLVRAVRWPPGQHHLLLRYRPPEVRAGAAITLAALLVAAALALLERRRRHPV